METTAAHECAERLRLVCEKMSLAQADLANLTGKSRAVISNYVHGKLTPSLPVLHKLGVILQLDMNWFFFGEGEMFRPQPGAQGQGANAGEPGHSHSGDPLPVTRAGEDAAKYMAEVLGHMHVAGDISEMLKCSSNLRMLRVDGSGTVPDCVREVVVTRAALDAHQQLLRLSSNVCEVLRDAGVESDTVRHIASELFKVSVEPLVK
jgi:transcriptional regulator with XRE-family HTH domain